MTTPAQTFIITVILICVVPIVIGIIIQNSTKNKVLRTVKPTDQVVYIEDGVFCSGIVQDVTSEYVHIIGEDGLLHSVTHNNIVI